MSTAASPGPLAEAVLTVLEAIPVPLLVVDEQVVTYANRRAAELFAAGPAGLLGVPVGDLLPNGVETGDQHHGVRRNGSPFPVEVTLIPIESEDGPIVALAVRDITRRRAREKAGTDQSRAYLSLVEMYDAIVRAPDEPTLLSDTCHIAVEHAGYLGAWVARIDEDGMVRQAASAGDLDEFLAARTMTLDPALPDGRGPTAVALREGRPVFSSDLRDDPASSEVREVALDFGIRASATLPLRRGGRTVAVLALYSARSDFFDGPMRALVAAVSENVSLAMERFATADRLRTVAAQRRDLARRLVMAQEEERTRIAADVHDDSVQSLAAIDLRLGLLRRQLIEEAPDLVPGIEQVQETVGAVSHGLRDLLFDLETTDPSLPLSDLLREAADHFFEDSDIRCTVSLDTTDWDGTRRLAHATRVQTLRIVKEAMINARKHAGATLVLVRLLPGENGVNGVVIDDGAGFDVESVRSPRGHRGLANMRDRAAVAGGWCRVESNSGGTTVSFWMPYVESGTDWDGT